MAKKLYFSNALKKKRNKKSKVVLVTTKPIGHVESTEDNAKVEDVHEESVEEVKVEEPIIEESEDKQDVEVVEEKTTKKTRKSKTDKTEEISPSDDEKVGDE